jgi:DNA-binding transcriptional MerR regulator
MSEQQGLLITSYSEPEIAEYSRLEMRVIRQLVEGEVITSMQEAGEERRYSAANLALLRRARRLYQDLGVNLEGVEIILRLVARIEALQHELAVYQRMAERAAAEQQASTDAGRPE